ncbi:hypothetical protein Acr_13g0013300 [Actinidia rufa]|uniref:WW domain-containing protein n=1 Tax=Actinidia rufa TaxID=165716 RepID=A0A7J0FMR1_9ERIC|nr:hypothetical protein Acr_13g0013300 [Actinidia rufa]
MTAPNMAAITASLERSLQNFSLNQTTTTSGGASSSDSTENRLSHDSSDATLELNSQISLPYHWEQCLDLKTGEIYYLNWRTGMKVKEDPRTVSEFSGEYYSEDDDSSYDSEESSSESSPSSSRDPQYHHHQNHQESDDQNNDNVLVVAGCTTCLMYFMVPKQVGVCPKCHGQLLNFDRSEGGSP